MTNNINSIDVSECGFNCWKHNVNELIEDYCSVFDNKCICNPDCYFKQFKRVQEENKELRQVRKNSPDVQEPYIYLYRQIKKQCHELEEENKKYKQALEEIRNIAETPIILDKNRFDKITNKINEVLR